MDFIEGLPITQVQLKRYYTDPFSAKKVATTFSEQVYKLHGLPPSKISDRDTIFLSTFSQELFKKLGVKLN